MGRTLLVTHHKNGTVTYSHSASTPVIVASGNPRVIPLEPEFITPQDGHEKQDCENVAAKRWLSDYGARYRALGVSRTARFPGSGFDLGRLYRLVAFPNTVKLKR